MTWLEKLMRPDLRAIAAYPSARSESRSFAPEIFIDANEFPWPPFASVQTHSGLNRYPEPQSKELLQRLSELWNIGPERLLLGRGSDEGIDVLTRLFCRAGEDEIMICPPTFGMYKVAAAVQGAHVREVALRADGQLDVAGILSGCTSRTKLIFIPSPNAPMGHLMQRADIIALCEARCEQSLVVADEAYVEFTNAPEGLLPELERHPNLAVLRTLSKAHALAGERVGAVAGAPDLISNLRKILAPYPLAQSSIRAALDTLSPNGVVENAERRRLLVSERGRMARLLLQSSWVVGVFPSAANFLLVRTGNSQSLLRHLRQFGILARDRHHDVANTVRFSIGTPAENDLVLRALGVEIAQETASPAPRLYGSRRRTQETAIDVTVNLDTPNFLVADTGVGFFDHMLAQLAQHGGFGLELHCRGDLKIDQHHTIEDCALALGEALKAALGDKRGIARFGFSAPLDEAFAQVTIDLSGRPYFVFAGTIPAHEVGGMNAEMVPHFFRSLATAMGAAIHVTVSGENSHHMVEAVFKATGRALRQAFHREGGGVPSTKGVL